MKKIHIYQIAIIFLILCATVSCKKALDIDPVDKIDKNIALVTSKDVEGAMVGVYSDMGSRNFYGGRSQLMADFLADDGAIRWTGTYDELTQTINKSLLRTNTFVDNVWRDGYYTINDANNVLSALDKLEDSKKDRIEGEAKFIRGASYFQLVRLYGKAYNDGNPTTNLGVPIILTPTSLPANITYPNRATVDAVYKQVIADLTDAEAKLPETNGFFATKYAAAAMLARIYLQMGKYTDAAMAADRVISSGEYELQSPFERAFPRLAKDGAPAKPADNTDEDILAMQVTITAGFNGFNEFYASSTYGGRGDARIYQDWIDATYDSNDDRINAFYGSGSRTYTVKFGNQFGNVPVIRLAEMYLIRAEANARVAPAAPIGGKTPLQDLAMVRSRAGLTTTSATVADILAERKLELAFEGFALHDAKRTQTNIGSISWNANELVFPIPQRERDANPNLTQKSGLLNPQTQNAYRKFRKAFS